MKVCWIGIIGRPNVGKSTLINKIINYDLSIISNKPQTTRDQILGIYTSDKYQFYFTDTPGIHKPQSKFGDELNKKAFDIINESDLILFLQPANEEISNGDIMILNKIKDFKNKIAIVTKSDLAKTSNAIDKELKLQKFYFNKILYTSSKNEKSILDLIEEIKKFSYEDVMHYDKDYITDKSELFLTKEIIRLVAIKYLSDELPHSIAIEITKYDIDKKGYYRNIEAIIYCKKESQKGIIIGKNGEMIKKIGIVARKEISQKFSSKVTLNLVVKVNKDWINNKLSFKKLGY